MRKTLGILGIAALTLTACENTAEQEEPDNQVAGESIENDQLRVYGGIQVDSENTVYDGADMCVVANPHATSAMKDLAGAQVKIINSEGSVEGVTDFQTEFNESGCSWYFETEIEGNSSLYRAEFLDYETRMVSIDEADTDGLMLDVVTPIADESDRMRTESFLDSFPG